ncbi:MAG TPA: hypothetical protein DCS66_25265 [Flavobacteriaceae bacterium]|nr:hypothetical protein [Flavobacteriaceae bacterium]|tara:strand:+ start:31 stop:276 length:246 start_codon:yes stop_codon:yes gene_type:complete
MSNTYIYFLNDSIKQLIELAKAIDPQGDSFKIGIVQGYYESIARLLNQAEGFGILEQLDDEIQNFEVESLLSNLNSDSKKV